MRAGLIAVAVAGIAGSIVSAGETPSAQGQTLFGRTSRSVTFGPYVRFEAGRTFTDLSGAN